MARKRNNSSFSTVLKVAELAYAVPQVVAHRVTRMALAKPNLSARDRKEFKGMVAEKEAAFLQSWQSMFLEGMRINQKIAADVTKSVWNPASLKKITPLNLAAKANKAALKIVSSGLGPIHRKATANAKRLARTKLVK